MFKTCKSPDDPTGHKLEPRYDITDGAYGYSHQGSYISPEEMARIIEATKNKVYVYDICVRCGKTVQRPGKR